MIKIRSFPLIQVEPWYWKKKTAILINKVFNIMVCQDSSFLMMMWEFGPKLEKNIKEPEWDILIVIFGKERPGIWLFQPKDIKQFRENSIGFDFLEFMNYQLKIFDWLAKTKFKHYSLKLINNLFNLNTIWNCLYLIFSIYSFLIFSKHLNNSFFHT